MSALKKLFFKDTKEEDISSSKTDVSPKTVQSNNFVPAGNFNIGGTQTQYHGIFDKTIHDILQADMEQANMPGSDYLELRKALDNMSTISLDERTKYIAAFSGLQATGASPEQVLNSILHYIDIANKTKGEFEMDVENKITNNVKSLENMVSNLQTSIAEKSAEIQKLTNEINEANSKIMELSSNLSMEKAKIESTRNNFTVTFNAFIQRMRDDEQKIKQYLISPSVTTK